MDHDIASIGQFIETKFFPTNRFQGKISKFINNKAWVQTRLWVFLGILFLKFRNGQEIIFKKITYYFLFLLFFIVPTFKYNSSINYTIRASNYCSPKVPPIALLGLLFSYLRCFHHLLFFLNISNTRFKINFWLLVPLAC